MADTYTEGELMEVVNFMRSKKPDSSWPAWGNLALSVLVVVVTVVLAYSALDKRMSLLEQKMDYIVLRVGPGR